MKSCPTCFKLYDDTWKICLKDSSALVEGELRPTHAPTQTSAAISGKKTPLLKIGLILFPIAFILNVVFMRMEIGGILRELTRLGTLVGFFLIIFGGLYNLFNKK